MNYLPLKRRLLYYNALIRPVFNYASVLWTNCDKESLGRVLKLQKRAARVILNAPPQAPSVPLFNRLKWLPFYKDALISKCIIAYNYKRLQGDVLVYLNNLLNPFAPGNFAEKRVLKLGEWFSGHCRAIKG